MAERRRNHWVSDQQTFPIVSGTTGALNLLTQSTVPAAGLTIVRTLLSLTFVPQTDETDGDRALIRYGLALLTTDAAVAQAFEDPDSPEQTDWLLLDHALVGIEAASLGAMGSSYVRREYDLRGARKLGNRDWSLFLILNNTVDVAVLDVDLYMTARVLCKMP